MKSGRKVSSKKDPDDEEEAEEVVGDEDEEEEILLEDDSDASAIEEEDDEEVEDDEDEKVEQTKMSKKRRGRQSISSATKNKKKKKSKSTKPSPRKLKLLADARNDAKIEFEKYRAEIFSKVPKKYQSMFGQIGFTKWNKGILPCLILNPFDVPPGEVRNMWIQMYEKKEKQKSLDSMSYLIYWYGAKDQSNYFGFIPQKGFVSYDKESQKKTGASHVLPSKLQEKVSKGLKLNVKDQEKVDAYREMEEDLKLKASQRKRGIVEFPEVYELLQLEDIDDDVEDAVDENDTSDDELSDASSLEDDEENDKSSEALDKESTKVSVEAVKAQASPDTKIASKRKRKISVADDTKMKKKSDGRREKEDNISLREIGDAEEDSDDDKEIGRKKATKKESETQHSEVKMKIEKGKGKNSLTAGNQVEEPSQAPIKKRKKIVMASEAEDIKLFNEEDAPTSTDVKKPGRKKKVPEAEEDTIECNEIIKEKSENEDNDEMANQSMDKKARGRKKNIFVVKSKETNHEESKAHNEATKKGARQKIIVVKSKAPGIFDEPEKNDIKNEQRLFQICEQNYLEKIDMWKKCLAENNTQDLDGLIRDLNKVVGNFSAPFVQAYGITDLIKQTESVAAQIEMFKLLKSTLFMSFAQKKQLVPKGFTPVLGLGPVEPEPEKDEETDESVYMEIAETTAQHHEETKGMLSENGESNHSSRSQNLKTSDKKQRKGTVKSKTKERKPRKAEADLENDDEEESIDDEDEADEDFFENDEASSDEEEIPATKIKSDEDELDKGTKERKKKVKTQKEPVTKTLKEVKHKIGKTMTDRGKTLKEHIDFKKCKNKFLPLIEKWKSNLDADEVKKLVDLLGEISEVVEEFSASFIEFYGLSDLLKSTKQLLKREQQDLSPWASLREQLRTVYSKKSKLVPKGFAPKVAEQESSTENIKQEIKEDESTLEKAESNFTAKEEKAGTNQPNPAKAHDAKLEAIPKSPSRSSLENGPKRIVSLQNESKNESKVKKPERKKFSLTSLMRPTSKEPENRPVNASSIPKNQQTSSKSNRPPVDTMPTWVKDPPVLDVPADDPRLFALEFLLLMARQFPAGRVNVDSVARSLEAAIFEWASSGKINDASWDQKYWGKIHAIVAAICGKRDQGTLMNMILKGLFDAPENIVKLSDDDLIASFESRPLNL